MNTYLIRGGNVGDPDLPTYEQVRAWIETLPRCSAGVVNCETRHKVPNPREHTVVEVCYNPDFMVDSSSEKE